MGSLAVFIEVFNGSEQNGWIFLKLSDAVVAANTKQGAYFVGGVVVVYCQGTTRSFWLFTDRTESFLRLVHSVVFI
jgi:hypothetical protein